MSFRLLRAVHAALLSRTLRFDRLAIAGVLSTVVSGVLSVGAAFMGAGVWALAIQIGAGSMINSAALWLVSDWRPNWHCRVSAIRRLLNFGVWISLSGVLELLYSQGFALLIGRVYGVRELGLYNRAVGVQQLPGGVFSSIFVRVALPHFSALVNDTEALRRSVRTAICVAMFVNLPIMAGLALVSDLVIVTLFGDQWVQAAQILSVLALSGTVLPLHVINLQLLLAQGCSGTFFRIGVLKKVFGIACVVVGSLYGVLGLAYSQLVFAVIALALNGGPTRRTLEYGPLRQLRDISDIVLATIVMAAAVLVLKSQLNYPPLIELLILVAAGAATYVFAGLLLRLRSFRAVLALLAIFLTRRAPDPLSAA